MSVKIWFRLRKTATKNVLKQNVVECCAVDNIKQKQQIVESKLKTANSKQQTQTANRQQQAADSK